MKEIPAILLFQAKVLLLKVGSRAFGKSAHIKHNELQHDALNSDWHFL